MNPTQPTPSEPRDTHGNGYGCACVSIDAARCAWLRYADTGEDDSYQCQCLCHDWDDEEYQ